jgi:multidrug transporter EmrE-like cation transporter
MSVFVDVFLGTCAVAIGRSMSRLRCAKAYCLWQALWTAALVLAGTGAAETSTAYQVPLKLTRAHANNMRRTQT